MVNRASILVVDDLATQRLTIEATLADLGEHVVSVSSGREALKYLLDHDVALILLDVNMPEMDGFETASLIRKRRQSAETPIIFLTADTDEMMAARGYALGAVDYLFCPFMPEVLRTKVRVFVSLSRARDQIRREAQHQIALTREQAARGAAEEQGRRLRLLVEAGGMLTRSHDGSAFEGELLSLFVPMLADEAGLVFLDRGQGGGVSTWVQAESPASSQPSPILAAPLTRVLSLGSPELIRDSSDQDPRGVVMPLVMRGETYGALGLAMLTSGRRFNRADLEIIDLVAGRTAIALDNRRLYRELQDRDRRKDEFLAMLSHELRNPLGAVMNAAQVLDNDGLSSETTTRARQVIARQALHLTRLVDDLLEVSRVTMGNIALAREPLDLKVVVERAIEALRVSGRLDRHDLTVVAETAMIEADSARMEQVVTNLLVNAVKYTDPGGKISVRVANEGEQSVVEVADTGIGVSPELLPRLFDVFVQGRQSLDRAGGGLGLGLTLVRRLVELQGGTVEAKSLGHGEGTTFIVRMPRLRRSAPARTEPSERAALPPLRVLIVEDNDDAREMLRLLLEIGGHEVHEATSGPDAVERAVRLHPHVALVDLGLPGFDGLEVARRLRADRGVRPLMLVALTGYGQEDDRRRTTEHGFDAHLVKPVSHASLIEVLSIAARRIEETSGMTPTDSTPERGATKATQQSALSDTA